MHGVVRGDEEPGIQKGLKWNSQQNQGPRNRHIKKAPQAQGPYCNNDEGDRDPLCIPPRDFEFLTHGI